MTNDILSYPARGTWIEILSEHGTHPLKHVVPRTGYVDRNTDSWEIQTRPPRVVPRTGYVDRNTTASSLSPISERSYPARGTWIEMLYFAVQYTHRPVVPRTGYVDRNVGAGDGDDRNRVVPRTGYVDRNFRRFVIQQVQYGRTPHGVRG